MLSVGMLGGALGSAIGQAHFDALRLDGRFSIDAGCFSRDFHISQATAEAYAVPLNRCYKSWQELLQEEKGKIDVLVILTPTPDHCEMVCAALAMDYDVIVEKALCTSLGELAAIKDTLSMSKGKMLVTYNYSGYPMVRELRARIENGGLGSINQVAIEMPQETFARNGVVPQNWRMKDYDIPTVSLDLGVHVFHLLAFLTHDSPVVSKQLKEFSANNNLGVIDNVYAWAELENGVVFSGWWGKTSLGYRNGLKVRVFGDKGAAEWTQSSPEILELSYSDGKREIIERGLESALVCNLDRYNRFKPGHPAGFIEAFANLYSDFHDYLVGKKDSDLIADLAQTEMCLAFLSKS